SQRHWHVRGDESSVRRGDGYASAAEDDDRRERAAQAWRCRHDEPHRRDAKPFVIVACCARVTIRLLHERRGTVPSGFLEGTVPSFAVADVARSAYMKRSQGTALVEKSGWLRFATAMSSCPAPRGDIFR